MKEQDIRPKELFREYLKLCDSDAVSCFTSKERIDISCPACMNSENGFAFEKSGFAYSLCGRCKTLYQSPRPQEKEFNRFYTESLSSEFWAKTFFPTVAEARRIKLFQPKVKDILGLCEKEKFAPKVIADIGAGYGLFLEEWEKKNPGTKLIAVEPNHDLAEMCDEKGFEVEECFVDKAVRLRGRVDLAVAFEVIEHVYDPLSFFCSVRDILNKNGRALFTGLTVDGFDIQLLWEKSKSVFPPHHINFMSIEGFEHLLKRAGFSEYEIFTPGKLDVDIVRNAFAEDPEVFKDKRFFKHLFESSETALEDFQRFLSKNRLSSHCWIWAKK